MSSTTFSPSPSPAATTSSRATTKRASSDADLFEDDTSRPARKRKTKVVDDPAVLAEKAARKEARMVRNRVAAQASRDRKKLMTRDLEERVAQLEAELAVARASSQSHLPPPLAPVVKEEVVEEECEREPEAAVASPQYTLPCGDVVSADTFSLPPVLPPIAPSVASPADSTPSLAEENESLRVQLFVERQQSAQLRTRLAALEDKFAKLEALISAPTLAPSTVPAPLPPTELTSTADSKETTTTTLMTEDSSCLVAAEAVFPSSSSSSTSPSLPLTSVADFEPLDLGSYSWDDWTVGGQAFPSPATGGSGFATTNEADLLHDVDLFSYLQQAALPPVC